MNFLINCEINLDVNCSKNFVILAITLTDQGAAFSVTDTKLYAPVVTLSTQDNAKLLKQLKSGFKRTINWNRYQSKVSKEIPKQYWDYLIDPSFPRVNKQFILSFENKVHRTSYKQ